MELLDPKTDLVFKLLLTRRPALLRSMIETVLDLDAPLQECEILDTSVLGEDLDTLAGPEKTIRLDVRVRLADGSQIDIEMQARREASFDTRLLFYWARLYGGGTAIRAGERYERLRPVVVIAWLNAKMYDSPHYHNVFEVRERTTQALLNDHLAIHILELPKARGLSTSPDEVPTLTERRLRLWSRFFLSQERGELEALAQEDPIMREAKDTLEELSADPQTRLAAQARETHLRAYYDSLAAEREAGEAAGVLKGKAEGRVETLLRLLTKRFGPLTPATMERVRVASVELVESWIDRIFEIQSVEEIVGERPNAGTES